MVSRYGSLLIEPTKAYGSSHAADGVSVVLGCQSIIVLQPQKKAVETRAANELLAVLLRRMSSEFYSRLLWMGSRPHPLPEHASNKKDVAGADFFRNW